MADVKWIKIVTDIFDNEKMLLIESLPKHDSIIVIWFKLLCLAGKQNNGGVFTVNNKIPYTDEMLATIFRRPLNIVQLALEVFCKYGMIEIIGDTITIPNWGKHQALDAYEKKKERDRMYQAKVREKQRALIDGKSDNRSMSDDASSIVVSVEKEREEDKDIYNTLSATQPESQCPFLKIRDMYHEICISYPKIKTIDGKRRKAVAARWRAYKSLDTFEELFRKAEESNFLKGSNSRNWSATFDWLIEANNMAKVLEDNYANEKKAENSALNKTKNPSTEQTGSFDTDEFIELAMKKSYGSYKTQNTEE